jgi:hypothetical protein
VRQHQILEGTRWIPSDTSGGVLGRGLTQVISVKGCFGCTQRYRLIRGLYVFKSPLGHSETTSRRSWVWSALIALWVSYLPEMANPGKPRQIASKLASWRRSRQFRGRRGGPPCGEDWLQPWLLRSCWPV